MSQLSRAARARQSFCASPAGSRRHSLTYAWTQTEGPDVNIIGADMAVASFTAPASAAGLTFQLTVSDSMAVDMDLTNVTVEDVPVAANNLLYVANTLAVSGFIDPATLNGNEPPDTYLNGNATQLEIVEDIAADANGASISAVSGGQDKNIVSFDFGATGNVTPDRFINENGTSLEAPGSMAIDRAGDRLFVADIFLKVIWIYERVSEASFTGDRQPDNVIIRSVLSEPQAIEAKGMDLGPDGTLYVLTQNNRIERFANPEMGGTVTPTPIIFPEPNLVQDSADIFVDDNDVMYLTVGSEVWVYDSASTVTNGADLNRLIRIDGATLGGIAVDRDNVGYITDPFANAIFVFDDIHESSIGAAPDRTIRGELTLLDSPTELTILE